MHVKTLRKISEFPDFDRLNVSLDRLKKIKKFKPDHLTCSIDTRLPLDRSKSKFDRSTSNWKSIYLKRSDYYFTWSIKTRETRISRNFLGQFSTGFLEQTSIIWTWLTNIDNKTKFHWCYSLQDQNSKLKQHHNIITSI